MERLMIEQRQQVAGVHGGIENLSHHFALVFSILAAVQNHTTVTTLEFDKQERTAYQFVWLFRIICGPIAFWYLLLAVVVDKIDFLLVFSDKQQYEIVRVHCGVPDLGCLWFRLLVSSSQEVGTALEIVGYLEQFFLLVFVGRGNMAVLLIST